MLLRRRKRVSLLSFVLEVPRVLRGALISDWGSGAVKCKGKKSEIKTQERKQFITGEIKR